MSTKAEQITYFIVASLIMVGLLTTVIPKHIEYAPYRNAVVAIVGEGFDVVAFDNDIFVIKPNSARKRFSIVQCRRRFQSGLFKTEELTPECGI